MSEPLKVRSEQLAAIRAYCTRPGSAVLFDEPAGQLLDVASAKTLPLEVAQLSTVEERVNAQTQAPYLLLAYGDGRQRVLADIGIAFAPSFQNTGPMPDLTDAVCFRDFYGLRDRLKHELYGHRERAPTKDTLKLLMLCIAVLDGARAAGFDVGSEERELETHLAELEKRAPPLPSPSGRGSG